MNYSRVIEFCKKNYLSEAQAKDLVNIIEDLQYQTIDLLKAKANELKI